MTLEEIVSITGLPGLYKTIGKRNDGLIVKSIADDKSQFVPSRTHMFSSLENITMYTTGEPALLKDILADIKKKEAKNPLPDLKDDAKVKAWFEVVLPAYDKEKVYVSDMRKLAKWYAILDGKGLIAELTSAPVAAGAEKEEDAKPKMDVEDKPKKEHKPKVQKSTKANTKPAPAAKKITTPRKAS
ncbi:MAG: DUF5606 domain-containing protein [Bacteroidetes bacterium]|nr:DUF5606 domain-containing protein [Bacteroidota bacterium]